MATRKWALIFLTLLLGQIHVLAESSAERSSRPIPLRPRHEALSPKELLQRVTAARAAFNSPSTSAPELLQPSLESQLSSESGEQESAPAFPVRSYRKQYPGGRRIASNSPQNNAASIKELLKQAGPLSLSEVLQQQNLSLSDLLQNKRLALNVLSKQKEAAATRNIEVPRKDSSGVPQVPQTNVEISPDSSETPQQESTWPKRIIEPSRAPLETFFTTERAPIRELPATREVAKSSAYLAKRNNLFQRRPPQQRITMPPPPPPEPVQDYIDELEEKRKKGDSREDILELLQPGSPVSLATLLSSRNMTLAELMDHRERGSRQQQLADLFAGIFSSNGSASQDSLSTDQPTRRQISAHFSVSTVKPRTGSRDPRLLDLPRLRPHLYLAIEELEGEQQEEATTTKQVTARADLYDQYDEEEEESAGIPPAVKSAILASGGLLGLALVLFAAIFLCCKLQQRRRRGSRAPFLRGSHLTRSERSVVIRPVESKIPRQQFIDF